MPATATAPAESMTNLSVYSPASSAAPVQSAPQAEENIYLINGEVRKWNGKSETVTSPIFFKSATDSEYKKAKLGSFGMLSEKEAIEAVTAAKNAYANGKGEWPSMPLKDRISAIEKFVDGLKVKRSEIVNILMWEICKTESDAAKEVDRSIAYIHDTVKELKKMHGESLVAIEESSVRARVSRAPLGVVLCVNPWNYPFNESISSSVIPALLMGNTVVLKASRVGCLCLFPTFSLFKDLFPKGVVNIVTGGGRELLPPIMRSGFVNALAFIGTSNAVNDLIKLHPRQHSLKLVLGLDAKNPGVVLEDADLNLAVNECVLGSLSFNGSRCTALKLLFVHASVHEEFVRKFVEKVDAMKLGLPFEKGVSITPLAEAEKPAHLKTLIDDALSKGARIANTKGVIDRSFVFPYVLTNVKKGMRIYEEEQFGPVVPIVSFTDINEVYTYLEESKYGQQASVFSKDPKKLSAIIDLLVHCVARVNINSQSQRGPDVLPFGARKDSGVNQLSVRGALEQFSMEAVVATKVDSKENASLFDKIVEDGKCQYLGSSKI